MRFTDVIGISLYCFRTCIDNASCIKSYLCRNMEIQKSSQTFTHHCRLILVCFLMLANVLQSALFFTRISKYYTFPEDGGEGLAQGLG